MSQADLLAGQTLSDSGFEGEYTYPFNELNPARRVSITRAGTGVLTFFEHEAVNYGASTSRVQTLELGQGYFLVSRQTSYGNYAIAYTLVRRSPDGSLVQYRSACDNWTLATPGVIRDSRNDRICAFRSFTALEAAALSAIGRGGLQVQTVYQPVRR